MPSPNELVRFGYGERVDYEDKAPVRSSNAIYFITDQGIITLNDVVYSGNRNVFEYIGHFSSFDENTVNHVTIPEDMSDYGDHYTLVCTVGENNTLYLYDADNERWVPLSTIAEGSIDFSALGDFIVKSTESGGTGITGNSTDEQVPTAKAVYEYVENKVPSTGTPGEAGGVVILDENGKIPTNMLPPVDFTLKEDSVNAVQNRIIYTALEGGSVNNIEAVDRFEGDNSADRFNLTLQVADSSDPEVILNNVFLNLSSTGSQIKFSLGAFVYLDDGSLTVSAMYDGTRIYNLSYVYDPDDNSITLKEAPDASASTATDVHVSYRGKYPEGSWQLSTTRDQIIFDDTPSLGALIQVNYTGIYTAPGKVDKDGQKKLSTHDFTTKWRQKLQNLSDKVTGHPDWDETDSSKASYILNKPEILKTYMSTDYTDEGTGSQTEYILNNTYILDTAETDSFTGDGITTEFKLKSIYYGDNTDLLVLINGSPVNYSYDPQTNTVTLGVGVTPPTEDDTFTISYRAIDLAVYLGANLELQEYIDDYTCDSSDYETDRIIKVIFNTAPALEEPIKIVYLTNVGIPYPDVSKVTDKNLMSAKLLEEEFSSINTRIPTVDDELSNLSTNPVQNKVITIALEDKVDKDGNKVLTDVNFTQADKDKLDSLPTEFTSITDEQILKLNNLQPQVNSDWDSGIDQAVYNGSTDTLPYDINLSGTPEMTLVTETGTISGGVTTEFELQNIPSDPDTITVLVNGTFNRSWEYTSTPSPKIVFNPQLEEGDSIIVQYQYFDPSQVVVTANDTVLGLGVNYIFVANTTDYIVISDITETTYDLSQAYLGDNSLQVFYTHSGDSPIELQNGVDYSYSNNQIILDLSSPVFSSIAVDDSLNITYNYSGIPSIIRITNIQETVEQSDIFIGNGEDEYTLKFPCADSSPSSVSVNGVLTTNYTYSDQDNSITFTAGSVPSIGASVVITYDTYVPVNIIVRYTTPTSIDNRPANLQNIDVIDIVDPYSKNPVQSQTIYNQLFDRSIIWKTSTSWIIESNNLNAVLEENIADLLSFNNYSIEFIITENNTTYLCCCNLVSNSLGNWTGSSLIITNNYTIYQVFVELKNTSTFTTLTIRVVSSTGMNSGTLSDVSIYGLGLED